MPRRHLILPRNGPLLISTDLHGNLEDFQALRHRFTSLGPDAHWAMLGDFVHGPNDAARAHEPQLYGYPDESRALISEVIGLKQAVPDRVHIVLGNHDHGHVGGPHPRKFHPDEVAYCESQ